MQGSSRGSKTLVLYRCRNSSRLFRLSTAGRFKATETEPSVINPSVEPSAFGGYDSLLELNEPLTLEWVLPQADGNESA